MTGAETARARPLRPTDPRHLGRYRLLGRLGQGGMGTVYLAERGAGDDATPVAVKVIRADLAGDEVFLRRFRGEVARARQVPPFCTAEVLDADADHDPPYLVVEYVDGPSLAAVVAERGRLSPANVHGLAIGVAAALTAIHGAGVIHRDLKPSNVLLAPGSPKVIDFGIARAVEEHEGSAGHTFTDQPIGTVAYMAPERFESNTASTLTPAADIFAWGAVVAYASTGRIPFAADSQPAIAYRIMTQPPDLTGLEPPLRDLVEQALAKDPAERPDAPTLLNRLLAAGPRSGIDLTAPRPRLLDATAVDMTTRLAPLGRDEATTQASRPPRRRRVRAAAGLLVLLAVAAVAAVVTLAPLGGSGAGSPPATATGTGALTAAVAGRWRGELVQSDGKRWSMELHLDEGGRTGTTTYPELRCVGGLTVATVGVDTLRYSEHIRSGTCTPDGTVTVSLRADGRMDVYYVPAVGGYTASAMLTRVEG
jgi:eukaryotic-like serine/threonine-protein kinase